MGILRGETLPKPNKYPRVLPFLWLPNEPTSPKSVDALAFTGFVHACKPLTVAKFSLAVAPKAANASPLKRPRSTSVNPVLPRTDRLRRMRDFALLSQRGRVVFGPFFTLRFRPSQEPTKIGFVASAKIFKTAVARNRVKRRLREALGVVRPFWPLKMDILFIAKPEATTTEYQALVASVKRAFEKIPEALKAPPTPRKNPKARRKTSVVYKGGS